MTVSSGSTLLPAGEATSAQPTKCHLQGDGMDGIKTLMRQDLRRITMMNLVNKLPILPSETKPGILISLSLKLKL